MRIVERRMAVTGLEVREDSSGFNLGGYASTFNDPYDMGWYRETVSPEAFKRTLVAGADVRLLINHDGLPLARTLSGTLGLESDVKGLRVSAQLDPTDPDVQSLAPKMKRGDLNQMSFAFRTDQDEWSQDMSARTLCQLDLHNGDVSVVTYPANPNASVGMRSGRNAGRSTDALGSAMMALEARGASDEEVRSLLTRALGNLGPITPDLGELARMLERPVEVVPSLDDDERERRIRRRSRILQSL